MLLKCFAVISLLVLVFVTNGQLAVGQQPTEWPPLSHSNAKLYGYFVTDDLKKYSADFRATQGAKNISVSSAATITGENAETSAGSVNGRYDEVDLPTSDAQLGRLEADELKPLCYLPINHHDGSPSGPTTPHRLGPIVEKRGSRNERSKGYIRSALGALNHTNNKATTGVATTKTARWPAATSARSPWKRITVLRKCKPSDFHQPLAMTLKYFHPIPWSSASGHK